MAKVDVQKIVSDMQKLYSKDKKSAVLIGTGSDLRSEYSKENTIVLPPDNAFVKLYGIPGLPLSKIVQFAGNPDTGKSTIGGELIAAAQKAGAQVVLWDSEDKFDGERLDTQFKGSSKDILVIKTNEILKGGELVRRFITAVKEQDPAAKVLFVWDSVGGSQSRSHAERELDNEKHAQPGQDAKENAQVCKMLISLINKYPNSIAIYMANQVYAKIGFMQMGDAASGGKKIEFFSSGIVFLKRIKTLTKIVNKVKVKYGIITRATVTKNHLSQGKTSVHQLDFIITADGCRICDSSDSDDDSEE
jgi:RecA/RadA recombinase